METEVRDSQGARPPIIERDAKGNAFELRPIDCPVCGPGPQEVLGRRGGARHRYGEGIETRIVRCSSCTLLFPNPFPFPLSPRELYGDPTKYFEAHDLTQKIDAYRRVVRQLVARAGKPNPSILDVGSGRGDFLHAASLEGLTDLLGLEFSPAMVEFARERFGITLIERSIEEHAEVAGRTWDAVVLNAVLEHVYDPGAMIASVARLVAPGGVLYIDIPQEPHLLGMLGSALNRLRGSDVVYHLSPTWPPFHVFGFSRRALTVLLERHGFTVEHVRVRASARVRSKPELKDRVKALVATQINRIANVTGTASNMYVWARLRGGAPR